MREEGVNRNWIGHVVIAVIIIGVAVLLYSRGRGPGPGSVSPTPASSTDLPGFRADAWMLPSDEALGFVEVPAGPFMMGSDKAIDPLAFDNERWSPEQARASLDLPAFYIARYEVTEAQFQAFVTATGTSVDPKTLSSPPDHPVAFVTWPEALAYCRWLEDAMKVSAVTPGSLKERLNAGWHVTLPSEAEWEKAARATDGRRYPWGDDARTDRANWRAAATVAVGSIRCPECAYGLSDMSGNVWEWTRSPYQPYPYDSTDDSSTAAMEALWVMRGGSFNDTEQAARAATRGGADPGARREFLGFRIALTRS